MLKRKAGEIRLRADRRVGELLKELALADHARGNRHMAMYADAKRMLSNA